MADDSGSSSGRTPSGRPQRPMRYTDASHPIFSSPTVVGPGAVWRKPTRDSEAPSDENDLKPEEPPVELAEK